MAVFKPLLTEGLSSEILRFRRSLLAYQQLFCTIPPTKIKDFCHLPLHKGGFGAEKIKSPLEIPRATNGCHPGQTARQMARSFDANQAVETAGILCVFQGFHGDELWQKNRQPAGKLSWVAAATDAVPPCFAAKAASKTLSRAHPNGPTYRTICSKAMFSSCHPCPLTPAWAL